MDNNNNNNQFGNYGGNNNGYTSPEQTYNPDAQYGFSSTGTTDAGNAQQYQNNAYSNTNPGGYNLNGQYTTSDGNYNANQSSYNGSAFQNSSGQYDANQYNANQYQSGGYNYSNGNYNMNQGSAPLDKNGQPVKNNFGMKLTFSIIEMVIGFILTCAQVWCFGLVPLALAIVACVLVCLQNKNYKEGNWNGFTSNRKASTVLLWVGFALYMLWLVLLIVVVVIAVAAGASFLGALGSEFDPDTLKDLQDAIESDSDYSVDDLDDIEDYLYSDDNDTDNYDSDYDTDDNEPIENYQTIDGEDLYIDGFNEFVLNGSAISLPMDMDDFLDAGFMLNDEDLNAVIEADSYDGYAYYDSEGDYLGTLFIYNVTSKDIKASKGIAAGITINAYDGVTLKMVGGITFDSSAADAIAAYGNPTDASVGDDSAYLEWYMNNRYASSLELDFWDGELSEVWIMNDRALE